MAKFLVALDGSESFTRDLFQFATEMLNDSDESLFVGMVMKDVAYSNVNNFHKELAVAETAPSGDGFMTEEDRHVTDVICNFEKSAKDFSVNYEIFNDFSLTAQGVVKQSTYADLLILSYRIFNTGTDDKPDTTTVFDILKGSRCPVLILPEDRSKMDNVIFTYDNKESSVFAIKAFSSLFARKTKNKVVSILTVTPNLDEEIKNEKLLLNLVQQHFHNVGIQLLEGNNISKEINNFAKSVHNPLIVMGAFGRSRISNMLIPSVAQFFLKSSNLPLFIAHR
ncbi:MAG: universal stress protein [Cyclobacteriaceae bacterium]|nr:universal stress protein [Cyclobacteriaceae bacterium]